MPHVRLRRATFFLALPIILNACDSDKPTPTEIVGRAVVSASDLTRAKDSAAAASTQSTQGASSGTEATNVIIPVKAGDTIVVTVQSTECSGDPETVKVYGAINQVVMAGSCQGTLPGQTATLGPVATDGTIYFTATHQAYGEGSGGDVSGAPPDYTVGLDDGVRDLDYNDVILSVTIKASKPRVDCTPEIERGRTVTCKAWGAGVEVTLWNFSGPKYKSTELYQKSSAGSLGNKWIGTAVASGTVSADVTINGARDTTLTTTLTVKARSWPWVKSSSWSYDGSGNATTDCGEGTLFRWGENTVTAWNRRKDTCDAIPITPTPTVPPSGNPNEFTVDQATTGPNEGLWYVKTVGYRMDTQIGINVAIRQFSPVVYALNKTDQKACTKPRQPTVTAANFWKYNVNCKQNPDFDAFWWGTSNHEGYGTGVLPDNGHQAQLEKYAALPEHDLFRILEEVFKENEGDVRSTAALHASNINDILRVRWAAEGPVRGNWACGKLWHWKQLTPTTGQFAEFQWTPDASGYCA